MIRLPIQKCAFVIFTVGLLFSGECHASSTLGVCQVIRHVELYSNKNVLIHAEITAGFHGMHASDSLQGVSCGVLDVSVSDVAYKTALRSGRILPGQTAAGNFEATIAGVVRYKRYPRADVRGVLSVTKILSWKPIASAPTPPPALVRGESLAPILSGPVSSNSGTFTLTWSVVPGATSYHVHQGVNGGLFELVAVTSARSWTSDRLTDGTYAYRVFGCDGDDRCGPASASVTVKVVHHGGGEASAE